MAVFPATLPQPLLASLQVGKIDPWVEDTPEVGAARRRVRFTRAIKTYDFPLRINDAQRAILEAFYDTTLVFGVAAFTWTDPRDGGAVMVRFRQYPRETNVGNDIWDVAISLTEI